MSVGQDLVGKVFHVGQYSTGTVADPSADPLVYTETDGAPGAQFGATDITITSVTTDAQGVTTIDGSIKTGFGTFAANGTLIGNDKDDFLINGTVAGQSGYIFLTNKPASTDGSPATGERPAIAFAAISPNVESTGSQPGVGNTADVAAESENIVYDPNASVCFVSGTRIRTARGDVAVERLKTGDIVVTASGEHRPIRWIGSRVIDGPSRTNAPVRILAGGFGAGLPERDLHLSPGHPVLVGADADNEAGHLVPIMCLINGTSVARMPVDTVTYWHVELDRHDILLADGLPAESFLDFGNRPWFGPDAEAHDLANPDFVVPGLGARCRPVAIDGTVVEAERRRLDAVFAITLAAQCHWPVEGEMMHEV